MKIYIIKTIFLLIVYLATVFSLSAYAEQAEQTQLELEIISEKPGDDQQRWAAFPIIASSPETGLMLGGMLFHFFPVDDVNKQASTIDVMAFATTEEQYGVSFTPNIFFQNSRFRFSSSIFSNSWTSKYYGIGNDSSDDYEEYESESSGVALTLEMKLFDSIILGLIGSYNSEDIETQAGGILQTNNIIGSENADYGGLGFRFGYDTRDNTNAPYSGTLAVYESTRFDDNYGSDFDYEIQSLDIRYYTPIMEDKVLALSAQMKNSHGQVPFRYLPTPDGTNLLRGIESGRYRDKALLGLQSEVRFPVWRRFSGTVFVEAAQVADDYSDMDLSDFKTSLGVGVRFALNPKQRFNVRADIAWVDDGLGVIINVREAF